ncbi:hypothetical protein NDU88_001582 [Pleurodeles waltl]|uniref:Uncharacterized protein n=1 Tax=Pleurodeles waltl TaxID=8319 RepID=A0AAV7V8V5_PLEWA|nr:hypothetical protein NDU88_001582 [Pleurodeles waltl]
MQATLEKILEAIEESKNTLRQEIRKVSTELSHLRADHRKLSDRVKTTEEELTSLGTQQRSHETQIAHLTDKVQRLEYRAEDTASQAREAGPFAVENVRVNMFPDYTAAVQAKQAIYLSVKKALREDEDNVERQNSLMHGPGLNLTKVEKLTVQGMSPGQLLVVRRDAALRIELSQTTRCNQCNYK